MRQRKNSDTFYFVSTTGEKEKAFPQYHDWDGHLPRKNNNSPTWCNVGGNQE